MNKIKAALKLTRIEHSIMLVIAVLAAEALTIGYTHYMPSLLVLALSLITPIFVSMGSFAINDYYDVKTDKLNKRKDRPLVNGSLSKREAMAIAMASFFIGVIASLFINYIAFAIALVFALLAILYSYRLKDLFLIGNVYIAFSMVIPFIYGNYVVSSSLQLGVVFISLVIFLAGLAREIHGMIRDEKGDARGRKSKNLVYHIGALRSAEVAFILYVEAIVISVYLYFFAAPFAFNIYYIAPIAITDIILAYVAVGHLLQKRSEKFFKFSRNASLAAMALALIAFVLAALL
jgi:geranylgeranylglycerol-phosphate geranylgeranyltransferase